MINDQLSGSSKFEYLSERTWLRIERCCRLLNEDPGIPALFRLVAGKYAAELKSDAEGRASVHVYRDLLGRAKGDKVDEMTAMGYELISTMHKVIEELS